MSIYTRPLAPADVEKIRQGYGLVRIYAAEISRGGETHRYVVRVDIERNAHDSQSHYRTDFLTDGGWAPLHRLNPETPELAALPSYTDWLYPTEARRAACVTAVEEIAEQLLAESVDVLTAFSTPIEITVTRPEEREPEISR